MAVSLDQLRRLATALPSNVRVSSGEAADVLSAALAVGYYGEDLIKAADEGEVGAFFYDHAVKAAKDAGEPEPQRGAVAPAAAPAPAVPPAAGQGVSRQEFEQFQAAVLDAIRGQGDASAGAGDTAAPAPTPAAAPEVADTAAAAPADSTAPASAGADQAPADASGSA